MSMPAARDGKAAPSSGFSTLAGLALSAIAFRMLSAAVAFIANVAFIKTSDPASPFGGKRAFWDLFKAWDAGHYFGIARNGVGWNYAPDGRNSIAFFPAYPLLMRWTGRLFGTSQADVYFGGILVSWT